MSEWCEQIKLNMQAPQQFVHNLSGLREKIFTWQQMKGEQWEHVRSCLHSHFKSFSSKLIKYNKTNNDFGGSEECKKMQFVCMLQKSTFYLKMFGQSASIITFTNKTLFKN